MTALQVLLDGTDMTTDTYAPLQVSWGRDHPGDSLEPRRCTCSVSGNRKPVRGQRLQVIIGAPESDPEWQYAVGTWATQTKTWAQMRISVTLFDGHITDTTVTWANDVPRDVWDIATDVVAVDPVADLGRLPIGDTPWPQESVSARAARIAALTPLTWTLDPSAVQVAARDVDLQPAADVMDDLAQWASLSGGIWYDPAQSIARLLLDASRTSVDPAVQLVASQILVDAQRTQTVGDVVNDVTVGYVNPADLSAQPSVRLTQADSISQSGRRSQSISTQLVTAADASARAQTTLTRFAIAADRWEQVVLDSRLSSSKAVAEALMRAAPGMRVRLAELPPPGPPTFDGYLEGWTVTLDAPPQPGADVAWQVEVKLSPATWSGPLLTWSRATQTAAYAVNPNPSFEASPYNAGWITFWRSPVQMAVGPISDGTAPDGAVYARVTNPAGSGGDPGAFRIQTLDPIAVAPGQVWHMACKVRSTDAGASIELGAVGAPTKEDAQWFGSGAVSFTPATGHATFLTDGAWHDLDMATQPVPASCTWARFDCAPYVTRGGPGCDVDQVRFYLPTATGRWADVDTPWRWMDALAAIDWIG